MPRATRKPRHGAHISSAKLKAVTNDLPSFDFAKADATADSVAVDESQQPTQPVKQSKREKQMEKRQNFLEKLGPSTKQLSKSSARRMKRKAKEQLTGGLNELQSALAIVEKETINVEKTLSTIVDSKEETATKSTTKPGTIGKSAPSTLSEAQRKRVLELERLRHPLILTNSEYASNPFKTIRTHAQNTLLQHSSQA